jgi:ribosomal protein S12 methylthiotransferase accessory factor
VSAIDAYRAYLEAHCSTVLSFPIDGLDRLGIPVWSALGAGEAIGHGVGYGWTAHDAERGALGEAVEDLAAARYAARVEPVELTVAEARERGAVEPVTLSLRLGTRLADDRSVLWVPARVWPDGGERLVPLEAAVTTQKEYARGLEPLFPPITNGAGAGAGDDLERAVGHGLNELLQRDLNWSAFKALDTGRVVDARTVDAELVDRLAAVGVDVRLKYSGHAFGVHAFHASAIDAEPGLPAVMRTATGEGADADPVVAGRKAVLELCSSRARKRFFFGGPDALAVAPDRYVERFAGHDRASAHELGIDLNARFDALLSDREALDRVVRRITQVVEPVPLPPAGRRRDHELEILVVEMTEPGEAATVAKVIVPGLEAEVLSHHRLGPRGLARLRERCPHAVSDEPVPGWEPCAGAWVDAGWLTGLAGAFFPLYREPDRHAYEAPGS